MSGHWKAPRMQLLCVGALKVKQSAWIAEGWQQYAKRMGPYCQIDVIEVAEEAALASKPRETVLAAEAKRILPFWEKSAYRVALSEHGKALSSEVFAESLYQRCLGLNTLNGGSGRSNTTGMIWVIGGPQGLDPSLVAQADWVVSLSPMTYPHQWVRLLWIEQLYRAFRIISGQPYHK